MNHYVYEITNMINNKKYIGKRSCKCPIEDDKYMGSGYLLEKAKKKYGIENFKKEILEICDTEELAFELEKRYIKIRNAVNDINYYNIASGGNGGNLRAGFSEDQIKKWKENMSKSHKGKKGYPSPRKGIKIASPSVVRSVRINEFVYQDWEKFCKKNENNKSYLLEEALKEFMDKYNSN